MSVLSQTRPAARSAVSESSRRETPPKFPTRQWVLRSVLLASKAGHASTARDYEAWYTGLVSRLPADERPSELRNWPSPTLIEVMFGSFEAARGAALSTAPVAELSTV
jgi:hypothetical protein